MHRLMILFVAVMFTWGASYAQPVRSTEAPVLEYDQYSAMIRDRDKTPRLRVYPSGKVVVHRPIYMKRSGVYEMTLADSALSALLDNTQRAIAGFSAVHMAERTEALAAAERQQGTEFVISDDTITTLTIRIPSSQPTTVTWDNLQTDARRYPSLAPMVSFATVERDLLELSLHRDLRKTDDVRTKEDAK